MSISSSTGLSPLPSLPPPQEYGVDGVKELIHQLNNRNNRHSVHAFDRAQRALQDFQRSDDAYSIASALLLDPSEPNNRFFGALTFTEKLRHDGSKLSVQEAEVVKNVLLGHLLRHVDDSDLVKRKLCGALVAYFLYSPQPWTTPVEDVFRALDIGPSRPFMLSVEYYINKCMTMVLWFATMLAEEVGKTDPNDDHDFALYQRLAAEKNVASIGVIMAKNLNLNNGAPDQHVKQALECFVAWVGCAQKTWRTYNYTWKALQNLTHFLFPQMMTDAHVESAYDAVADLFGEFYDFLTDYDLDFLNKTLAINGSMYMDNLLHGDFSDDVAVGFVRLLTTYASQELTNVTAERKGLSQNTVIMDYLVQLMQCEGIAAVEDSVCQSVLDFWSFYCDGTAEILDSLDTEDTQRAKSRLETVIRACLVKAQVPPPEARKDWDLDTRSIFQNFRRDTVDMMLNAYQILGMDLFKGLVQYVVAADQDWKRVEVAMFCLNGFVETLQDDDNVWDEELAKVFSSPVFNVPDNDANGSLLKAKSTALAFTHAYASFFKRHPEYLTEIVRPLFSKLGTKLAKPAMKAFASISKGCGRLLSNNMQELLEFYRKALSLDSQGHKLGINLSHPGGTQETLPHHQELSFDEKADLLGSFAAIVVAAEDLETQRHYAMQLLELVQTEVSACHAYVQAGDMWTATEVGLGVLDCLQSVGKGFQSGHDVFVDLDDSSAKPPSVDWFMPQMYAFGTYDEIGMILKYPDLVIESTCKIIRTGFPEQRQGPFTFDLGHVTVLSKKALLSHPPAMNTVPILDMVGAMILSGHSRFAGAHEITDPAQHLLDHIGEALIQIHTYLKTNQLLSPSADPEVASAVIEVLDKCLVKHAELLYHPSSPAAGVAEDLLRFALDALIGNELLPKRNAAQFWSTFIDKYTRKELQAPFASNWFEAFGRNLVRAIIYGLAGRASRSEIETLVGPLTSLMRLGGPVKGWLAESLGDKEIVLAQTRDSDRKMLLAQIMATRGRKPELFKLCREFWFKCSGSGTDWLTAGKK